MKKKIPKGNYFLFFKFFCQIFQQYIQYMYTRNSEDIQSCEITNKWFKINKKKTQLQTKFDFNVDVASKKNQVLNYKCIKRL